MRILKSNGPKRMISVMYSKDKKDARPVIVTVTPPPGRDSPPPESRPTLIGFSISGARVAVTDR